jgi:hypothetical protein
VISAVPQAAQNPELAVLSAMAHGSRAADAGQVQTAVNIATAASSAFSLLSEDTRKLYLDIIDAALSDAARKAFVMLPEWYQFQGPTALKAIAQGKLEGRLEGKLEGRLEGKLEGRLEGKLEGKLEGLVQGEAEAVLAVLETRGLALSDAERERILSCSELTTLRGWVRKAVTVSHVAELFA